MGSLITKQTVVDDTFSCVSKKKMTHLEKTLHQLYGIKRQKSEMEKRRFII